MGFRKSQEIVIFNTKKTVMMKANEIRVGNWINDPRQYDPKFFQKTDNGYFKATARDIQYAEEFEPIPLTAEILLKCGFEKTKEYFLDDVYINRPLGVRVLNERFILWISIEGDSYYSIPYIKIKYLHQLQNLYFALTGKELEIDL